MEENKCGCEQDKETEEKLKEDTGCGCGEETMEASEEDSGCGCGEETIEAPEEDEGCGCGTGNTEAQDRGCCGGIELPDLSRVENPDKPKFTAEDDFIREFEDYAHSLGVSNIGYTQITPDLLIKDKFIQYPFTIVLIREIDKEILETPPGDETKRLNDLLYEKFGNLTYKLSDYLRENGFATEVAHPEGGLVNFSPLAQYAGLGYIGESGLLITPELGPRIKISAITVSISNLPYNETNEHEWIPDYCKRCGKCIKACPEKALIEEETCCGGTETKFIRKLCIGCSHGCTYCIESCPFEEKGYEHVKAKFDKMTAKLKEKQNKKFEIKPWYKWAKQNYSLFTGLINGATVVISMAENDERMVLLEKQNEDLKVNVTSQKELKNQVADLMFVMTEKDMGKLLEDNTPLKFIELLSSGKVQIYALKSQPQLMDKGYNAFLGRLGFSLGGGGGCCC